MSPIICRCCGQHIEPAPDQPRTNPNLCAACEASKGFETQIFERQMNENARGITTSLPGPKLEDARPQSR
ncbi:MAG TPA: hypothetical protein VGK40_08085 [Verrucomicrobiae bacterium]